MSQITDRELTEKLHEVELTIASGFAQMNASDTRATDELASLAKTQE